MITVWLGSKSKDTCGSESELVYRHQISQHLKACRLRIKEQDQELRNLRRDLKQIKRHVQTYEVLATTTPFSGAFTGVDENQTTEVSLNLGS